MESEWIRDWLRNNRQMVQYILIGFTGVTWDLVAFIFLTKFLWLPYLLANAVSVSLGIANNFFLNAFYNFQMRDRLFIRFMRFYMIGLVGMGLSSGLMYVFVNGALMNQVAAKMTTIVIVALIQFYLNRTITFSKTEYTNGHITHSNTSL